MPTVTLGAVVPAVPYPAPVPPPTGLGVSRVSVTIDAAWLPYVIGCCKVLTANSTFDPPDPGPALAAIKSAYDLLNDLSAAVPYQPCPDTGNCGCDCEDCMQLRFNGCQLQQFDCVTQTWVDVPTVGVCTPNSAPGGGMTPPGPAACQDYQLQFPANALTVLPFLVNSGDTLQLSSLQGAGSDGTPTWFCPDGGIFFGGACVGGSFTSSGDPINTAPHMSILVKIGANYYSFYTTSLFTVPSGVTNEQIYIGVNDSPISDDAGTYSLAFAYCNNQTPPTGTWRAHINFKLNSAGFISPSAVTGSGGLWTPGTGWVNDHFAISGDNSYYGVTKELILAASTTFTSARWVGAVETCGSEPLLGSFVSLPSGIVIGPNNIGDFEGAFDQSGSGGGTGTAIGFRLLNCYTGGAGTGSAVVTDLYLAGNGPIPPELAAFSY